jgi:hypothetical protein
MIKVPHKAAVDRGAATGFCRPTGFWPDESGLCARPVFRMVAVPDVDPQHVAKNKIEKHQETPVDKRQWRTAPL